MDSGRTKVSHGGKSCLKGRSIRISYSLVADGASG